MYPIHEKRRFPDSLERLDMLWEGHPQYREMSVFTTLEELLREHDSYQEGFDELRDEYIGNEYEKFLIQLSWSDLPYRFATKKRIESAGVIPENAYVEAFMDQFRDIDTDVKACFLFPESYVSHFFVVMEACRNAESLYLVKSLFPDEAKRYYSQPFGL